MTTAYVPPAQPQQSYILCADCGTLIEPNSAGLCVNCLRSSVDITSEIPKQSSISYCKNCNRYLSPPQSWLPAELESRELLAICLRRLKGLNKIRLIDAGFIWTEPHSKRLRVKLTVQKEVLTSTVLQQIFEVEFVVAHTQCGDCARLASKQTWKSIVQVRQKVDHKRTFLYLEQLILKQNADQNTLSVKEVKNGLDFHYASKQHANKMVEFLMSTIPGNLKVSEQLVSQDIQNATTNSKTSYSVEIAPICKDDLVCLPLKLARSLSNISQLVLCHRISNSIQLIDPQSLRTTELSAVTYFRSPFNILAPTSQAIEFVVLDIEPTSHPPKVMTGRNGKVRFLLADAQVCPVSSSVDSSTIFHTRTHLGQVLKPGDTVLGYWLGNSNFNNPDWESMKGKDRDRLPEVVLFRKTYPNRTKKGKRNWKLRSMVKDVGADGEQVGLIRTAAGRGRDRGEEKRQDDDYERFLQDLEEDEDLRANIQLFKKKKEDGMEVDKKDKKGGDVEMESVSGDGDDEDIPKINTDELLDEDLVERVNRLGLEDQEMDDAEL